MEVYSEEPSLAHLACNAAITLGAPTALEDRGRRWGEGGEGFSQGEPKSSPEFCVGWEPHLVELDTAVSPGGGMARAIIDDRYVAGPPALVFPAIRKFEEDTYNKCVLTLQRTKCKVFSWTGEMPNNVIPGFTLAGTEVDGRFEPGFICVGAPIGTDSHVKNMMRKKVSELRVKVTKTVDKLEYWLAQSGGGGS